MNNMNFFCRKTEKVSGFYDSAISSPDRYCDCYYFKETLYDLFCLYFPSQVTEKGEGRQGDAYLKHRS